MQPTLNNDLQKQKFRKKLLESMNVYTYRSNKTFYALKLSRPLHFVSTSAYHTCLH